MDTVEIYTKLNSDQEFFNQAAAKYGAQDKAYLLMCIIGEDTEKESDNPCLDIAERHIVDLIYKQAKLEGIDITYPQTVQICNGRSIDGLSVEDVVMINNLKNAWKYVLSTLDLALNFYYLSDVNHFVQAGLRADAGKIRAGSISINGTDWVPDTMNLEKIERGLDEYKNDPIGMCIWIMHAQPFSGCNELTALLICNKMLIKRKHGVLVIPPDKFEAYFSRLIAFYEGYGRGPLSGFLDSCIITG